MHRARFASLVVLLAAFAALASGQEPPQPPEGRVAGWYGGSSSGGAGDLTAKALTSSAVTRPAGPVPRTSRRSTPSSRASRRVAGEAGTGPT